MSKMLRRSFVKLLAATPLAALFGVGKAKAAEEQPTENKCVEAVNDMPKWEPTYRMDFTPDEIVAITVFEDRCIVACKHSVWAIDKDYKGKLQRQQIKFT